MNDGKLLVCGYTTEDYEDKYYITDIDFKNASEMTIKKAEGQNSGTYIQNVTVNPTDGSIWYVKNVYSYSDNTDGDISDTMEKHAMPTVIGGADGAAVAIGSDIAIDSGFAVDATEDANAYYLVKVDAEGNIVSETYISADLTVTDESGNSYQSSPSNLVLAGNKLLFCVDTVVKVYNADTATKENEYKITDQYIDNLYVGASGTVYYVLWGENGQELYKFDPETGKSDKTEFTGLDNLYSYQFNAGTNGYEFILTNEDSILAAFFFVSMTMMPTRTTFFFFPRSIRPWSRKSISLRLAHAIRTIRSRKRF